MAQSTRSDSEHLGLVWIDCPYPVATIGLAKILEKETRVHVGREAPAGESPSSIILGMNGAKSLSEGVKQVREANPGASVLVFGLQLDLPLARAALRAGAHGFIHAAMRPEQIVRAIEVVAEGEIVVPRELLGYLVAKDSADLNVLSARQREILKLVGEGLTNAQIAKELLLSESTVKQHLRAAYKVLGVKNRTEAAKLIRESGA